MYYAPIRLSAARQAIQRGAQDYILDNRLTATHCRRHCTICSNARRMPRRCSPKRSVPKSPLNSIGDGVISTDVAGNVTYLNQVAEAMAGWTGVEALGRALSASSLNVADWNVGQRHFPDPSRIGGLRPGCYSSTRAPISTMRLAVERIR